MDVLSCCRLVNAPKLFRTVLRLARTWREHDRTDVNQASLSDNTKYEDNPPNQALTCANGVTIISSPWLKKNPNKQNGFNIKSYILLMFTPHISYQLRPSNKQKALLYISARCLFTCCADNIPHVVTYSTLSYSGKGQLSTFLNLLDCLPWLSSSYTHWPWSRWSVRDLPSSNSLGFVTGVEWIIHSSRNFNTEALSQIPADH